MYVFSLSLSFVVSLLRGTSKVTRNTQKRSNQMEHCIEVKWVSATYRCSSTAMSAAPVGRMQRKNQRGQSWANCQDQMESKNSRARKPRASFEMLWAGTISKDFDMDTERMSNSLLPTPFSVVIVKAFNILWILVLAFSETVMTSFSSILVKTSCEVRQPTTDFIRFCSKYGTLIHFKHYNYT